VDRSPTGLPSFFQVGGRADLLCGVGYSGNGVAPAYLGGRVLAALALRRDDEWSSLPLARAPEGRFPPEPACSIGGAAVLRAVARRERLEDAGRRPNVLIRSIASLAPTR
jgi:hypothetical protein